MTDETIDMEGNSFVTVAVRHGILKPDHVEKILDHARQQDLCPSDAALTLSMLELYEVDAVNLLLTPRELAPGYELTGLMGCGAGGMVFRANQIAMNRDVALKTINLRSASASTTGKSRIQREAHAIARLHHPNIVAAYDSGFHQGRFCIAMELVDGETLAEFIERNGAAPEPIVWQIVRQVASALAHAWESGIIHRDIKPANLLLTDPPAGTNLAEGVPFVKVADFGLALEREDGGGSQLTAEGTTLGTPSYVAPEQLQDSHVDQRADIYSLGATAFHMLGGTAPLADRSPMKAIMSKTIGDDRWRETLPKTVSDPSVILFRAMTESAVEDRIEDYNELIEQIDEALASLHGGDLPVTPKRAGRSLASGTHAVIRRRKKKRIRNAAIIGTLLLVAGTSAALVTTGTWGGRAIDSDQASAVDLSQWPIDAIPTPLFNGESIPLFRKSGNWAAGKSDDGGRVLIGAEGSWMQLPLWLPRSRETNARLRFATAFPPEGRLKMELLGEPSTAGATLWATEQSVEMVDSKDQESKMVFSKLHRSLRFQVFQHQNSWMVMVNGEPLGSFRISPGESPAVMIHCDTGEVQISDLDIVPLVPGNRSRDRTTSSASSR